ncbi:serine hydroxymethyltransferase [Candidatus Woesearchaeota archaeon]|nr:MAG: serine hydroxymethyltransferase [Candidatus Woesearchaeota archaeon]
MIKMDRMNDLEKYDPEIAKVLRNEIKRQEEGAEMIASENFVSRAVLQAMGSVLTNKYSEGYPGKRYYGGNEFIDISENLAIERAKQLFNAEHANVQSHSGSQANAATYLALLKPGDTVLGMSLDAGGHLTHGSPVNFSGKTYNFVAYGVDENGFIDYEELKKLAIEHKPKLIIAGFSAYPGDLDFEKFREAAEAGNSYLMADIAHIAGLIAGGVHSSPFPHCDVVTTTTHKTLRGPRGAMILCVKEDRLNPDAKRNLAQRIDSAVFPGSQGGPLDHVIAAKAVAFKEALEPAFKEYQEQVVKNAKTLAQTLLDEGIGVVSGQTTNHLVLIDLTSLDIGGKEAEAALDKVHIFTNKNMIPNDPRSPFDPSGIRVGTPALTTRGLKEEEIVYIGQCIAKALKNTKNDEVLEETKKAVMDLISKYPLYPNLDILI